ncbi:MAG: response regulator [Acidobacteriota bacterium]|nr:response regulator [Acidobacteriota bacterium]
MTATATSPLVLIVDDEPGIRELERRILERGSYRVLEASGAAEAFALFADGLVPDLLIADLDLPEMPGEQMVPRIREARPGLKVLYVSASFDRLLNSRISLGDGEAFVDKPFTPRGLLEGVSLLLYDRLSPPLRLPDVLQPRVGLFGKGTR